MKYLYKLVTILIFFQIMSCIPTGGGVYVPIPTDIVVTNKAELLAGLAGAVAGDRVYVDPAYSIDLTGEENITIPGGVTLTSHVNPPSLGALLYTNELDTWPLFRVGGGNINICNLRFRGPSGATHEAVLAPISNAAGNALIPVSNGLRITQSNVTVDNCEFYNWQHSGVYVTSGAQDVLVTNSNFHHNQRHGLGYGVAVGDASVTIEYCDFDFNRHSITGTGEPGCKYVARFNCVGPNGTSHAFDMHGWPATGGVAGDQVTITDNKIGITGELGIMIRAVPSNLSDICNNTFPYLTEAEAIVQVGGTGNLNTDCGNLYKDEVSRLAVQDSICKWTPKFPLNNCNNPEITQFFVRTTLGVSLQGFTEVDDTTGVFHDGVTWNTQGVGGAIDGVTVDTSLLTDTFTICLESVTTSCGTRTTEQCTTYEPT